MSSSDEPPEPGDHGEPRDPNDPYDLDAATTEHYVDAALYDFEYRRRRADVNHYRRLAKLFARGEPILELGCGSGRVAGPLARDGHTVVGVDLSAAMLERARWRRDHLPARAAGRISLVRADMRRFVFGRKFPLIICPFNAFQHMYTRADVEECLASVREHLDRGGRFAFDVLHPDLRWLTRDPRKRWSRTRFTHPTTGEALIYTTNQTYDPVAQITYIRIYYESAGEGDRHTHVVRLAHRQFFPAELEALMVANGLKMVDRFGGFDEEPFASDSDAQVVICAAK